ncbi:MAG: prolyl oligopeptidase family serine peptidase [Acidobacteriota bacterium]
MVRLDVSFRSSRLLPRFAATLIALVSSTAWAAPDATGPIQPWTTEDLLTVERISDMALTDDGSAAFWIRSGWAAAGEGEEGPPEFKPVAHLFMARLGGDAPEPVQLTRGVERASGMAISPNGRHVAFIVEREQPGKPKVKGPQVWILPLTGGEARPLTGYSRGVGSVHWLSAKELLVQRAEDPDARERQLKRTKDTSVAVDDVRDAPPVRLFKVSLDGTSKRLTENEDWIEQVAVSPNGQHVVITAGKSLSFTFDSKVPPRTYLVDPTSGERTEILEGSNLLPRNLRFSNDSKSLFFIDDRANETIYRNATVAEVHRYSLEDGSTTEVDPNWERGIGRGFEVSGDALLTLLADGARYQPARLHVDGTVNELTGTHADEMDRLTASRDGSTALYLSSTGDRSPQLFVATVDGDAFVGERRLGHLNATYARRPAGRTEVVRWIGAEGDEVEGVLSYPFDYETGSRYPLILDIHGGPTGYDRNSWDASWGSPTPLWRQRGAFVFRVNYHGSGNYGLAWAESIKERYYELEIPDIESGVDMLIEKGLVDPDRMATSGWSNGGILSAALITHTDRYKAAIIGAADVEWISDWANVDFGASFDNYYFGGPPWERLDHYIEKSPFFKLPEVTTPSLVHTGTEDRAVPPHQSWSIFRVMQQVGKADVRLLLYPGEPHGLRQIVHQRRKINEDLEWFDRHLFKTAVEESSSVPKGSALESAFERAAAATTPQGLGVLVDGHLVPEAVEYAGLRVGRFEVTRAQWAAYLQATGKDASTNGAPDLPVAGVSFEAAKAYVAWLAKTTGDAWRLPTAAEAKRLAGKGGNTLDAWLGYRATPGDAAAVAERLESSSVELLKPVGSHTGTRSPGQPDGAMVFDLDGNVAEWAVAEDGTGHAAGPSAERPSDSAATAAAGTTGLRVVMASPKGTHKKAGP